jgi:hypothetical protein
MKEYRECRLTFNREVSFLGRNGTFKAAGIEIRYYPSLHTVDLYPVTTKNQVARARIELPAEDLARAIKILIDVAGQLDTFQSEE